jgi:hypothetical protein
MAALAETRARVRRRLIELGWRHEEEKLASSLRPPAPSEVEKEEAGGQRQRTWRDGSGEVAAILKQSRRVVRD